MGRTEYLKENGQTLQKLPLTSLRLTFLMTGGAARRKVEVEQQYSSAR